MKKYLQQYRPFLLFLASFFGCYILLTIGYQYFLNSYEEGNVDAITQVVAHNAEKIISLFVMRVQADSVIHEPFVRMYFQNDYVLRIVEGCNGISVIILFISFIVAFSGRLKNTLLFIFGGSLMIYILNVLRIIALIVLLHYYPEHSHILHGVLFPLIIYGLVIVLWVIWVNKFSKYAK